MIQAAINLNDPAVLPFVAEYLDARLAGILGPDWSIGEYVRRRLQEEQLKQTGGLSAGGDDDFSEQDL